MSALWVREECLNATNGYYFGDSGVYETFAETRGELFRAMQREYGRCAGRVYVDTDDGVRVVGWVFESRQPYEDKPDKTYMREVWVTVHTSAPERTTTYHYDERPA